MEDYINARKAHLVQIETLNTYHKDLYRDFVSERKTFLLDPSEEQYSRTELVTDRLHKLEKRISVHYAAIKRIDHLLGRKEDTAGN